MMGVQFLQFSGIHVQFEPSLQVEGALDKKPTKFIRELTLCPGRKPPLGSSGELTTVEVIDVAHGEGLSTAGRGFMEISDLDSIGKTSEDHPRSSQ